MQIQMQTHVRVRTDAWTSIVHDSTVQYLLTCLHVLSMVGWIPALILKLVPGNLSACKERANLLHYMWDELASHPASRAYANLLSTPTDYRHEGARRKGEEYGTEFEKRKVN